MAREELSAQEIYERLAVKDVQLACDVLRGAWEAEHHDDGFASLEVAPEIERLQASGMKFTEINVQFVQRDDQAAVESVRAELQNLLQNR